MYDVIVVGGGVTGAACAWALSRYQAKVLLIEKEEDVCSGTSKANSAIVHGGYDAEHGTLMAKLNVEGSRMMEQLAEDLDVPYERCGSLVVCLAEEDRPRLQNLLENGIANGVEGLRIVERKELLELEPGVTSDAVAALWVPSGAIVCPFLLTIAMAENAFVNGVEFAFDTRVTGFERMDRGWKVCTDKGDFESAMVVNAAGVYAGTLHNMVCEDKVEIVPTRGDYLLLDRQTRGVVKHTIFTLPGVMGKGVLISPTVHGNTIVGPTAIPVDDPEATATTAEGLNQVTTQALRMVPKLPLGQVITSFAGLRAKTAKHDFQVGECVDGFVDCVGMESPGLSAAPAVGKMVAGLGREKLNLTEKSDVVTKRKGSRHPSELSVEERRALVEQDPSYGQIVCRCEGVTEGEILDAIHRPLGARSLDGIKRRVRTGMGRCQGGFCTPRVMEILARELGVSQSEIRKAGAGSKMILGVTKEGAR